MSRQDYIARTRYSNDLPPPPAAPRSSDYSLLPPSILGSVSSPALLLLRFRKEHFHLLVTTLSPSLGMPLSPSPLTSSDPLEPADRALLRQPGAGTTAKGDPGVLFLRRTEYIIESRLRGPTNTTTASTDDATDPDSVVAGVELTFVAPDLAALRHPRKRSRKAVRSWALFPDVLLLDQRYMAVRFVGSAAVLRPANAATAEILPTAVFRPRNTDAGEWVSLYSSTGGHADVLAEQQSGVVLGKVHGYKRVRDYDLQFSTPLRLEELAVSLNDDGTAAYLPVGSTLRLSTRRVPPGSEDVVRENTVEQLAVEYVAATVEEERQRDEERSVYDPLEYGGEE